MEGVVPSSPAARDCAPLLNSGVSGSADSPPSNHVFLLSLCWLPILFTVLQSTGKAVGHGFGLQQQGTELGWVSWHLHGRHQLGTQFGDKAVSVLVLDFQLFGFCFSVCIKTGAAGLGLSLLGARC